MELLSWIGDVYDSLEAAVVGLGASPWLIVVVFGFCCADAVFPLVPSDSFVTAGTVLALASGASSLFIVGMVLAASLGAWLGDSLAYYLGTKIPVHRLPGLRGEKGQAALRYARRAFAQRGSTFVLTGRFIPVGRIVVNMTAGATGFPVRRFLAVAAFAGVLWAGIAALMGIVASHFLEDSTLFAMLVGVGLGLVFGLMIDWLVKHRERRYRT